MPDPKVNPDDEDYPLYYGPTNTQILYNQNLPQFVPGWTTMGKYFPIENKIRMTPEGGVNPDFIKHEIVHAILTADPRLGYIKGNDENNVDSRYALYQQMQNAVKQGGAQYKFPPWYELIPTATFGGYGFNELPQPVQQQMRTAALQYSNQNMDPRYAAYLDKLAKLNRFYPEYTKSPGSIPIQPQPAPSLLQHFLAMIGNQQGPSPWGS